MKKRLAAKAKAVSPGMAEALRLELLNAEAEMAEAAERGKASPDLGAGFRKARSWRTALSNLGRALADDSQPHRRRSLKEFTARLAHVRTAFFEPRFTLAEAADISGIPYHALRQWIARGQFQLAAEPGRRRLYAGWDVLVMTGMQALMRAGIPANHSQRWAEAVPTLAADRLLGLTDTDRAESRGAPTSDGGAWKGIGDDHAATVPVVVTLHAGVILREVLPRLILHPETFNFDAKDAPR